jgi:Skp family chaperone for outer membrane proteins
MKGRTTVLVLFVTLLFAAASSLTGCATTGTERATKTTNSMQTVESDYRQVSLQVDATNASLQELINPEQVDLKKALDNYKTNVAKMQKLGKQLDKHTTDMSSQGQNYFSEWEKQGNTYTNPQIRQLSEERRLQLRDVFSQIPEASVGVKGSLHSYLADIGDIQKFLSTDLTPKGVEGITPVAQKAMQDGEDLKTSVRPVLAAIDHARTAMAQGGANTGAAAGGEQPGAQRPLQPLPEGQQPLEQQPEDK